MKRLVRFSIAICLSAWAVFAAGQTFDDATQCPDKDSHRSDIVKCFTFDEQLDACPTGRELACAVANGYEGALKAAYAIRRVGDAAAGGGYLEETTTWGSSGSFMTYTLPSGQREFSLRYYQRWGGGFMDYPGGNNHTMAVGVRGNSGPCANILHIDGDLRGHIAINHSCNPSVVKLWDDDVYPGRWYLIEFYGRMETNCRDNTRTDGCDGYFAVYLDGVKKLERTNWNWGGGSSTATFDSFLLPRTYYQAGFPSWQPRMAWDNIVVGNDADIRIGAAAGESNRGVAGSRIYFTSAGADPFMFRPTDATRSFRPQGDCGALPGVSVGFVAEFTRGLLALDTLNSNARGWLAATRCTYPGPVVDGSIKLSVPTTSDNRSGFLTSDIDNVIGQRNLAESGNDSFIGGSIYLHDANVYADRPILAGHMSGGSACRGMFCQWIGVTIDGGRWALGELFTTDSPATRVFGVGPPATPGEWHSFEVGVMRDGYADLWVDGVKVISRARIPSAPGGATNKAFVGVSHLPTRTQPFAVNFDDIYWSNVSREACYRDWGADCPADSLGSSRPPRAATVRPLPPSDVE